MEPQLEGCGKIRGQCAGGLGCRASMEPQLEGCGKLVLGRAEDGDALASMEPQLEGCGKNDMIGKAARNPMLLQWSRNLRVAESPRWSSKTTGGRCFNGAAT